MTAEEQQHALTLFAEYLNDVSWMFAGCGNQAVIIVSAHSRKVHTAIGAGMAQFLSPACARSIMDGTHDRLTSEQYADAIHYIILKYR